MSDNKYITELDKVGLYAAAREELEIRLGLRARRSVFGISTALESIEDLAKRDDQREEDGFSRKIKFKRILVGPGKVVTVPYVEEERLTHGDYEPKRTADLNASTHLEEDEDITVVPGTGDGEVGEVIGETPLPVDGSGQGPGDEGEEGEEPGEGGEESVDHVLEEGAYEFGKRLTDELELPNLTEKRKRFPTDEYTYELTDRHHGSGQLLDKKETLKKIARTNLLLGRVDRDNPDPSDMVVGPHDRVYRVLSRERIWKSQAVVIFLRDYSGSMHGDPTEALVTQHLMIYSWLLVQYEKRVIPRFFMHDTNCEREVTPKKYFNPNNIGGGTRIVSGYKKINEVVEGEGLAEDYDIFVFQGSDGDDSPNGGKEAVPELEKILSYVSRMGVTLFKHRFRKESGDQTTFEKYVQESGFLERKDVFRMHAMPNRNVSEEMNIEAIKALVAQD